MKCITVFLLGATAMFAQDFVTGQAARLVIGQPTFTSQDSNSSDTILGAASGIAYAADTLIVADSNRVGASPSNHRVLLYQNLSGMLPSPTATLNYDRKCPVCVGKASVVLGQPDFTTTAESVQATRTNLRLPTAVASDGVRLVIADTNHNRVLIWNRMPVTNNAPADVVVGQANFTSFSVPGNVPSASSMRGPQGVWIQNGKLYVADTQNNRVLIFNKIPTANGAAADVVLGQPNMTTFVEPDLTQQNSAATANLLLNPVSVASDGVRLFVTDLGYNRVLIWNSIPTSNQQAADVVLGQPDMTSSIANYGFKTDPNDTTVPKKQTPVLCAVSNGTDTNSNPTYPQSCNSTLNFPRFVLPAGDRLFIADGGNDRVLVYNKIPTQNGVAADYVIGQIGGSVNQASDAADSLRTPMSLAWDGTNLYVSDAYNRRITVYSIGITGIPYTGVRNAASLDIVARATVSIGGAIQAGDSVTINIGGTSSTDSAGKTTVTGGADYKYTVTKDDSLVTIVQQLASQINAANSGTGDTNVYATPNPTITAILLTSRLSGDTGNGITVNLTIAAASSSSTAQITAVASGSTLTGGGDAAQIAPGSMVSILGKTLAFTTASADPSVSPLPTELAGTQVYFNGIRAPVVFVSPEKVTAQIPWELADTTSINAFVRSQTSDGTVQVTSPVAVSIVPANPGIYAQPNTQPSVGLVYHGSSTATGIVSVDGTAAANDTATVTVEDRTYTYTVQSGDSLDSIRDALVSLINQDPKVTAEASGVFDRILLRARIQGPEGNGIVYGASANSSASVIMTAIGTSLCCANVEGSQVTQQNPAVPGEMIIVYATGVGLPVLSDTNKSLLQTGVAWPTDGPVTSPASAMNAIAAGKTADVISATLMPGQVGLYKVLLHLNPDLPTDPISQLTIAQDIYVSNIVVLPIVNLTSSSSSSTATGSVITVPGAITSPGALSTPPAINANGVVNGASFQSGIAARAWGTIMGSNLSALTDTWDGALALNSSIAGGALPAKLDAVSVTVGGKPAYLSYVSPGQINFLAPDVAPGPAALTVTTSGGTSSTYTVNVGQYSPAFFQWPGSQAVATHTDFSLAARSGTFAGANTAAVKPGETVILWGTGFGPTSPSAPNGVQTPADQIYSASTMPQVTINGVNARVVGAALAPGFAGLYQVAVEVPASLADGDYPVLSSVNGVSSPGSVVLSVRK